MRIRGRKEGVESWEEKIEGEVKKAKMVAWMTLLRDIASPDLFAFTLVSNQNRVFVLFIKKCLFFMRRLVPMLPPLSLYDAWGWSHTSFNPKSLFTDWVPLDPVSLSIMNHTFLLIKFIYIFIIKFTNKIVLRFFEF